MKNKTLKLVIFLISLLTISIIIIKNDSLKFDKLFDSFIDTELETPSSKLMVGTFLWLGYEPLFLARDLGYYDEKQIRFVEYLSATQTNRALRNNSIHIATNTLDEAILLLEQGLDIKIILIMDESLGGDAIIGKPEIQNFKELRGKRVGVANIAVSAYLISRAFDIFGMSINDVNIMPLQGEDMEKAFKTNQVDAIVTYEPTKSILLSMGGRNLFDSSQIPGEIIDVLVIQNKALQLFPKQIDLLLKGWFKSLDYLREKPAEAALMMSQRMGMTKEEVLIALEGMRSPNELENKEWVTGENPVLINKGENLVNFMLKKGFLKKNVNLKNIIS